MKEEMTLLEQKEACGETQSNSNYFRCSVDKQTITLQPHTTLFKARTNVFAKQWNLHS